MYIYSFYYIVSISDEGSLPEIALSDASKLASKLYFLVAGTEHVLCAIHSQVAIKFLESGLLTWRITCCVYLFFTSWQILYLNIFCSVIVICHFNI